ncbi:unnamed protein product [Agarophyton chilense]
MNFEALASRLRSPSRSPLHVVLDVHGVLVERVQTRSPRARAARQNRGPWRTFSNRYAVWLRPHLNLFLSEMFRRHTVAIWSSAEQRNIEPLLEAISAEYRMSPTLTQQLQFVWHRSRCRPDKQTGKYASIKSLHDLWVDREHGDRFTRRNTLLVDDSPKKTRLFPHSAINVREYNAEGMGNHYNHDDSLLWLLLYLEYIAERVERIGSVLDASAGSVPFEEFCRMGRSFALSKRGSTRRGNGLAWVFFEDLQPKSKSSMNIGNEPAVILGHDEPIVIADDDEPIVIADDDEPIVIADDEEPIVIIDDDKPIVITDTGERAVIAETGTGLRRDSSGSPISTSPRGNIARRIKI